MNASESPHPGTLVREQCLASHGLGVVDGARLLGVSRQALSNVMIGFPIFPEFKNISYLGRYDVLCQKLVKENLYTAACTLASPRAAATTGDFSNMSELSSLKSFITAFAGHIAAEAARS
jgi:hypothetical protein